MEHAQSITACLVGAIESTWQAIQAQHPDVPELIVTIGAGSTPMGLVLGHFAPNRWVTGEEGAAVRARDVCVRGGTRPGCGFRAGTLLHEAERAAAATRGLKDTSPQSRHHNANYRQIGEGFELALEHNKTIGWSTTWVPGCTADAYAAQLKVLHTAMIAYRCAEGLAGPTGILGDTGTTAGHEESGEGDDKPKKPERLRR